MSNTPVTPNVEPTAAPAETTPARGDRLASLSDTERHEWLKTGTLPEPVESAASPTVDDAAPGLVIAEAAPSEKPPVEPVAKPPKPRDDINARLGQLTEQRRLEKDRADRAEQRVAALEAETAQRLEARYSKPAEPVKPPTHLELVKKYQGEQEWPKLDDYIAAGFDDPYASMLAAQAAYIGERQFSERSQAESARTIRGKAEADVDRTWKDLKAKYPDADPSSLRDLAGQSAPIFAQLLFESPLSVELLNYFSRNPAEARTLAAMEPLAAAHALGKVESQLSTPAPSRIATKTTSDAPEPPMTLGARHTPGAGDDADDALKAGDFPRYRDIMNKREIAGAAR